MNLKTNLMLLNYLFDGAYLVNRDSTIVFWNPAAELITGYTSAEVIGSKCYDKILLHVNSNGESMCDGNCPLKQTIEDGLPKEMSTFLLHKQGYRIPVMIRTAPVQDIFGDTTFVMETFTESSRMGNFDQVKELARKAFIDSRSGLPNKEYMDNKLRNLLASDSVGNSNMLGLFFIHLDNLRKINDDFGITAGDITLKTIGKVLSENIQLDDIIGRLDGGLFLIITHLDKSFLMLNWANKLKNLVEHSTVAGYGKIPIKLCISGLITSLGASLDTVYNTLEEELKKSREIPMNVSICDFTPPK